MKRQLIFGIALVALLLSFAAVQSLAKAAAPSTVTGKVIAMQLRVRNADNVRAKVLTMVKRGAILTVLGKDAKGLWLKVQVSDGTQGWVSRRWVNLGKVKLKDLPVVS